MRLQTCVLCVPVHVNTYPCVFVLVRYMFWGETAGKFHTFLMCLLHTALQQVKQKFNRKLISSQ